MVKYKTILKIINETVKTHDGTSLGRIRTQLNKIAEKIREKKKEQAYILDENGNIIQHKQGTKNEVELDTETLKNQKNLHITHNHPSEITLDDIPTTLSHADLLMLNTTNNDGDYIFRSISAEAPNGTRITLIRNNKFDESNEYDYQFAVNKYSRASTQYKKLILQKTEEAMFNKVQQYKTDHPNERIPHMELEVETRKEVIKEIGSLNSYLEKEGVLKSFEDCNCKLRITNNKVDWESKVL